MLNISRRGFLKIGTEAVGSTLVLHYAEPFVRLSNDRPDWVIDKGSYFEIIVPDFKSIDNVVFEKPVLLMLGDHSEISRLYVDGFVNVYQSPGSVMRDFYIDSSLHIPKTKRGALNIYGGGVGLFVGGRCIGNKNTYGVYVADKDRSERSTYIGAHDPPK